MGCWCSTRCLRAEWSLRDGYTPSVGAPVGRDRQFVPVLAWATAHSGVPTLKRGEAIGTSAGGHADAAREILD